MENHPEIHKGGITVLYDGACPLCRREISMYRNLQALQPIAWRDVSTIDATLPNDVNREVYMGRFHVQLTDGKVVSGAEAFITLWSALPGWRWLGRIGRLPGMQALMEVLYSAFLSVRPKMQRIAKWLEARNP